MNDQTNSLNIKIILLFIIVLVLLHSIYLAYVEREKTQGRFILREEDLIEQAFYNRLIITIIFFYFFIVSYVEYQNNQSLDNLISLIITLLTFAAACIEIMYTYYKKNQTV